VVGFAGCVLTAHLLFAAQRAKQAAAAEQPVKRTPATPIMVHQQCNIPIHHHLTSPAYIKSTSVSTDLVQRHHSSNSSRI